MKQPGKQTNIAIGVVLNYRLGPSKDLQLSTHVLRDESDDDVNKMLDRIRVLGNRQEAMEELPIFKKKLNMEKRILKEHIEFLKIKKTELPDKIELLQAEYKNKITSLVNTLQDNHSKNGRKGQYQLRAQDESRFKAIEDEMNKKISDMTSDNQGAISTTEATIRKTEELIKELEDSIEDREQIVNPSGTKRLKTATGG